MIKGIEMIKVGQKVWLQVDHQPSFATSVTGLEEGFFWVSLPKEANQVLVLQQSQKIRVGISLAAGFYSAEATVKMMGNNNEKFYGITTPEQFTEAQERKFLRGSHANNVQFEAGELKAQTAMVNFSAGGMMVYLVPALVEIINSRQIIKVNMTIDNFPFTLIVRPTWQKDYDNIPFAGFEFVAVPTMVQESLAILSERYSDN